jgi:hypothetical protein
LRAETLRRNGRWIEERTKGGKNEEGSLQTGTGDLFLRRAEDRRPVDSFRGRLFVESKKPQVRNRTAHGRKREGSAAADLTQRKIQLEGKRIHVVGPRDSIYLLHLEVPGRASRLMMRRCGAKESEGRNLTAIMTDLGVVVPNLHAISRDVRDR